MESKRMRLTIWLTNYKDKYAKNPQIVKINDSQAVVMWETFDTNGEDYYLDTYYMIISDKKLTTIGKKAFYNCKKIGAVTLDTKKLTKVGKKAFTGITKNATFYVPASKKAKYQKLLRKAGLKKSIRIRVAS